jgi:hypothetical protein
MLKRFFQFSLVMFSVFLILDCAGTSSKGITIKGKISDASDLRVFLDKLPMVSKKIESSLIKSMVAASLMSTDAPLDPGIYRIRIGSRNVNLILDGTEKNIEINGSLADMDQGKTIIKGSAESIKVNELTGKLFNKEIGLADLKKEIANASNPLTSLFFALGNVTQSREDIDMLKGIVNKLREKYPKSPYTTELDGLTTSMERDMMANESKMLVKEGSEAPNISLPNPVVNHRLNSLRGGSATGFLG